MILLGDFNSDVPGVQPGDEQAFQALLDAGFAERGVAGPLSCCVSDLFTAPPSEFDHQVDHILSEPGKKVKLVDSSWSSAARGQRDLPLRPRGHRQQAEDEVAARGRPPRAAARRYAVRPFAGSRAGR